MKIAYCLKDLKTKGGLQQIVVSKANWLVNHGCEVDFLLTDSCAGNIEYQLDERIRIINLEVNYFRQKSRRFASKIYFHFYNKYVHRIRLRDIINNYDIVISTFGNEMGILSGLKCRCKKILEFHGTKAIYDTYCPQRGLRGIVDKYYRSRMYNQIKSFDKFVILSENEREKWNSDNVTVIPNALFVEKSHCARIINSRKVVAVGRLAPEKDFESMISIWGRISAKDWKLHIYGDGSSYSSLQRQICEAGLTESVVLNGFESDLDVIYSDAAIYLLTSKYEGFSLSTLEACMYGLPIVAFECGGEVSKMVNNNINGFLIESRNSDEFVKKLTYIMNNPEIRIEMGKRSKDVTMNYEVEYIMNKWISLFREILSLP